MTTQPVGETTQVIVRNVASIVGLFRLYVSVGEQADEATRSAVDSLAECHHASGRPGVEVCLSQVRQELTTRQFPPNLVADWLTLLAMETDNW